MHKLQKNNSTTHELVERMAELPQERAQILCCALDRGRRVLQ
jgi:hypothetical protein